MYGFEVKNKANSDVDLVTFLSPLWPLKEAKIDPQNGAGRVEITSHSQEQFILEMGLTKAEKSLVLQWKTKHCEKTLSSQGPLFWKEKHSKKGHHIEAM
jgi:hypothetical protein